MLQWSAGTGPSGTRTWTSSASCSPRGFPRGTRSPRLILAFWRLSSCFLQKHLLVWSDRRQVVALPDAGALSLPLGFLLPFVRALLALVFVEYNSIFSIIFLPFTLSRCLRSSLSLSLEGIIRFTLPFGCCTLRPSHRHALQNLSSSQIFMTAIYTILLACACTTFAKFGFPATILPLLAKEGHLAYTHSHTPEGFCNNSKLARNCPHPVPSWNVVVIHFQ